MALDIIKDTLVNNDIMWALPLCLAIFFSSTFIPYKLTKNTTGSKYISRRWVMVVAWFCLLLLGICLGDLFINSKLCLIIAGCAVGLAGVYMIASTWEEVTFKRGTMQIDVKRKIYEQDIPMVLGTPKDSSVSTINDISVFGLSILSTRLKKRKHKVRASENGVS